MEGMQGWNFLLDLFDMCMQCLNDHRHSIHNCTYICVGHNLGGNEISWSSHSLPNVYLVMLENFNTTIIFEPDDGGYNYDASI